MRKLLIFAGILFFFAGQAFAEPMVELEGRYWITGLKSHAKVTENALIGTDIDLVDDLGMGAEDFPEVRLKWNTGPNSMLRFAYTQVSYGGDKNIERTITFAGQTYTVGALTSSELEVNYYRLGWAWQFINIADDTIKAGLLLDAKAFMLDVSLDAPSLGFSEAEDFAIVLPTIGGILDINLGEKLNLFFEASGLPSAGYGHLYDAEIGIKFIPIKNLSIIAGYRVIDIELEDDNNYGEMDITGPFFGATFRF
ncbi:hypothetical protein ACFL2J_06530 [Candidatus Omnitrophota bacterium]